MLHHVSSDLLRVDSVAFLRDMVLLPSSTSRAHRVRLKKAEINLDNVKLAKPFDIDFISPQRIIFQTLVENK